MAKSSSGWNRLPIKIISQERGNAGIKYWVRGGGQRPVRGFPEDISVYIRAPRSWSGQRRVEGSAQGFSSFWWGPKGGPKIILGGPNKHA
jgi:hypothetical protein